jgi:hypothetical protein
MVPPFNIASGSYNYTTFKLYWSERLSGNVRSSAGVSIDVMNQTQFSAFSQGKSTTSVYSTEINGAGSVGVFLEPGTYFIVFDNANTDSPCTVTMTSDLSAS